MKRLEWTPDSPHRIELLDPPDFGPADSDSSAADSSESETDSILDGCFLDDLVDEDADIMSVDEIGMTEVDLVQEDGSIQPVMVPRGGDSAEPVRVLSDDADHSSEDMDSNVL